MSEKVSETSVNPICEAPLSAACRGDSPVFQVAGDVLNHDDGIVHYKARRDGERHQGEVVDAEPGQIHHAKCANQ